MRIAGASFRHVPNRDFRPRLVFTVFAAMGLALASAATRADGPAQTPGQQVLSDSQRVIRTLSERRAEFATNPAALHAYVRSEFTQIFDRVYTARLVLGHNGRSASDTDIRAFADALANNLMMRYANSLLKIDPGLNVKVTSETPLRNGTIIKVASLIDRRIGSPVDVDYLFHQNGDRWQAFDVIVEGVSLVQTFRTQFDAELRTVSLTKITEDLRNGTMQADATGARATSGRR
jgi:phospholipid transport system substrate-binding protein